MSTLLRPERLRAALPIISLLLVLLPIFYLQPRTLSYFGLNLLLNLAIPIVLATMAQMCIITVSDLDLSIGSFVSFVACVGATLLAQNTILGIGVLAACILVYGILGALIEWRHLPSIVVTLGMSFVWLGLAVLLLPTPGGTTPDWLQKFVGVKIPYVPFPIIAAAVISIVVHLFLMRSSWGTLLRGAGGNAKAVARAGWSLPLSRGLMYALAGFFGVLSGLTLVGITTSADANIALRYTLISIAAVILGGGEFVGGKVSPSGAVIGAITLTLAASFLSFLSISPDWQIGAQGAILILVLSLRALIGRGRT
jgi:ribose transport system permease protein